MRRFAAFTFVFALALPIAPVVVGQAPATPALGTTDTATPKAAQKVAKNPAGPVYAKLPVPEMVALLPPPPPQSSGTVHDEIKLLKKLERSSEAAKTAAVADSRELDVFVYRTVLGDKFSRSELPETAALSDQLHRDSDYWNGTLKKIYKRPRPYRYDTTLNPLCGRDNAYSYPSGHSMVGYLEAMMLAEMVPEQREAIFKRADDYAHNRSVCGAHYPSDTKMSHEIAATLFGVMLVNPEFEEKLAAAKAETRRHLGLPEQVATDAAN